MLNVCCLDVVLKSFVTTDMTTDVNVWLVLIKYLTSTLLFILI